MKYYATMFGEIWEINVKFVYPPIPVRYFDWFVGFDNFDGQGCYGETLEDALENLYIEYMNEEDYCLIGDKPQ